MNMLISIENLLLVSVIEVLLMELKNDNYYPDFINKLTYYFCLRKQKHLLFCTIIKHIDTVYNNKILYVKNE